MKIHVLHGSLAFKETKTNIKIENIADGHFALFISWVYLPYFLENFGMMHILKNKRERYVFTL